jgi:hypothetical protein
MNLHRWLGAALLVMAAGCATTRNVDSFEAADANVAARRTFAWMGGECCTPAAPSAAFESGVAEHVRQAVVEELTRKGYVEVSDPAAADMRVSYQVAGTQRFVAAEDQRIGAPSPNEVLTPGNAPLPPASLPPREMRVREGSVILFFEDPASGRLIWRGLATEETRVSSTEGAIHQTTEMARQIAQEFPTRRTSP